MLWDMPQNSGWIKLLSLLVVPCNKVQKIYPGSQNDCLLRQQQVHYQQLKTKFP